MGLFGKKKRKDMVFEQDLSKEDVTVRPGGVFAVQLLMKEACEMPSEEKIISVLEKHLGKIECSSYDEKFVSALTKRYSVKFKDDVVMPPKVMFTSCTSFDVSKIDELHLSQFWHHKDDYEQILSRCNYSVTATDMLAGGLPAKERAELDMDFVEALLDIYPECEALYFLNSGNLFLAEEVRHNDIPKKDRFIYFAVNVRFFNIQNSDDKLIDTLGLSLLRLPDLQYHFHIKPLGGDMEMDIDWVVNHAYNTAVYLLDYANDDEDFFIKDGDTIGGIRDGKIVWDIFWKCHYEDALIQPPRLVLDICMNEYAAGGRDYTKS